MHLPCSRARLGRAAAIDFEIAAAELRNFGITLTRLLGEYHVNFRNGAESTVQTAETIGEVLDLGWQMAAEWTEAALHTGGRDAGDGRDA